MSRAVWLPDTPGGGGVRIENMVLITEVKLASCRELSKRIGF
jgi:Xaa-Pro aminopeptidase